jgi:hypothetical protein
VGIPLSFLFVLALLLPAWANEELHPGGRLFFPLWDVSTPNRLTFVIVTREALNEDQEIKSSFVGIGNDTKKVWYLDDSWPSGNCQPRGKDGSGPGDEGEDLNRTDLGGTSTPFDAAKPVFVDDVHFEYYGKSCTNANEIVRMSCGDIDLFLLGNNANVKPRAGFASVAGQGRGALDVHLVDNSSGLKRARKDENSLMGTAIISDLAEGWAAVYPAAAAKSTYCPLCGLVDQGNSVGYENFPMETYLPFAFADHWAVPGGQLRNVLSLWGPAFMPGGVLSGSNLDIVWKWWDGRERPFDGSVGGHAIIAPLGGDPIAGLDTPIDGPRFNVANFTCDHDATGRFAENDGFPRNDGSTPPGQGCNPDNISVADVTHTSDNFENVGDIDISGSSIQQSTSIGHWRFALLPDGNPPLGFDLANVHSGRGLVGVVLSSASNTGFLGVGDSWRLWHKDPCGLAQSATTFGPPHLRDAFIYQAASNIGNVTAGDLVSFFNGMPFDLQSSVCEGGGPRG